MEKKIRIVSAIIAFAITLIYFVIVYFKPLINVNNRWSNAIASAIGIILCMVVIITAKKVLSRFLGNRM